MYRFFNLFSRRGRTDEVNVDEDVEPEPGALVGGVDEEARAVGHDDPDPRQHQHLAGPVGLGHSLAQSRESTYYTVSHTTRHTALRIIR